MASLTPERLRELVSYNPETGIFTCLIARRNRKAGDIENKVFGAGYIGFCIDGQQYTGHRLAWLYVYGVWPEKEIDHVNGDKTDNRFVNLREADRAQNTWNTNGRYDSTSGLKGVMPNKKRWMAQIQQHGILHHLGTYDTPEQAHAVYCAAARRLRGEFARV